MHTSRLLIPLHHECSWFMATSCYRSFLHGISLTNRDLWMHVTCWLLSDNCRTSDAGPAAPASVAGHDFASHWHWPLALELALSEQCHACCPAIAHALYPSHHVSSESHHTLDAIAKHNLFKSNADEAVISRPWKGRKVFAVQCLGCLYSD
jgi:hypothetical protein